MNAKKCALLLGTIILLFCASCYKEGDLDALKNPIHVELDPAVGTPLVSTSITMEDLLGLLDEVNSYVKIGENDEVILVYADSAQVFLNTNMFSKSEIVSDTISGELDVDIFENMGEDSLSFSVGEVFLSLDCFSKTYIADIPLKIKNLNVQMVLPDGSFHSIMSQDSLLLNDLQVARTNVVKRMPIADILNNRPNKFLYSLEVEVDLSRVTTEEVENIPEDIELDFYFDLEMVLSGSTPGIYLKDTLDFDLNLDVSEIEIKDSKFILEITNNLPFDIDISLEFADSLHNHLCYVFDAPSGHYNIRPASVDADGFVVSPSICRVEIPFDSDKIDLYNKAKGIHLSTYFATVNNGEKIVTIQKQNGLKLRLGAVLHPSVSTDFDLGLDFNF